MIAEVKTLFTFSHIYDFCVVIIIGKFTTIKKISYILAHVSIHLRFYF